MSETQATRTRRQRERRRRRATGVRILAIPVDEYRLVSALLEAGRLKSPGEALDAGAVAREASWVLGEWSGRWLK